MIINKKAVLIQNLIGNLIYKNSFPLLEKILTSELPRIYVRPLDISWSFAGCVPNYNSGFNFFTNDLFTSRNSKLYFALTKDFKDLSVINGNDQLIKEVLFLIHDYIHWWSYRFLAESKYNKSKFGHAKATPDNVEDFAFCHLLSETAATVGLDYWFLANIDLRSVFKIDTLFKTLTISPFHISNSPIYKRFSPEFDHNKPDFFGDIASFYSNGNFIGFDQEALVSSPTIYRWIRHELIYGESQRVYSRQWFRFLSGVMPVHISRAKLAAPFDIDISWRKHLVQEMGEALRDLITKGKSNLRNLELLDPSNRELISTRNRPDAYFTNISLTNSKLEDFHDRKHAFSYKLMQFELNEKSMHLVEMINSKKINISKLNEADFQWLSKDFDKLQMTAENETPYVFSLP